MAHQITAKDARAISKWHLALLSQLSSIANDAHVIETNTVRRAYESCTASGCFEQCFNEEVVNGHAETYRSDELDELVVALSSRKDAQDRSSICADIIETSKAEVEALLTTLQPALNGLIWAFTSGQRQVAAEVAYDKLRSMKDGVYGTAASAIVEDAKTHSRSRELVWQRFANDPREFREQLLECCYAPPNHNCPSAIKDVTTQFEDVLEKANSIEKSPDKERREAESAIQKMLACRTSELLAEIPLEELRRYKKAVPVIKLRNAGCTTIADLEDKKPVHLVNEYGIKLTASFDVANATQELKNRAQNSSRINISADNKNEVSAHLVTCIYRYIRATEITSEYSALPEVTRIKALEASSILEKKASPYIWPFRQKSERAEVANAYKVLDAVVNGEFGTTVAVQHQALKELSDDSLSQLAWDSFTRDPAEFFGAIEQLAPGTLGSDKDFLQNLPRELAEELKEETLSLDGLKCQLRRYQVWGVKYILHQKQVLLGDEMGLGKTIEAIAAMVTLQNAGARHFLVICPASVLPNWCQEIRRRSDLEVSKIHAEDKRWALSNWIDRGGVAVTTYKTARVVKIDATDAIDMLVVDEAHYIKNPGAKRSHEVLRLSKSSKRILFMTGTALENRIEEMITLISYLRPDIAELAEEQSSFSSASTFREIISPVYYRRKRKEVLSELPELIEYDSWCDLNKKETIAYENAALQFGQHAMRRVSWNVDDPNDSSKLKRLREVVEEAKNDDRRVIVFSFYLKTISMIHSALGDPSLPPITGSTTPALRQRIIEEFDKSPAGSILISQIMAGGTGLNIQAASVVVICEPQYKPSTESQAISRAYRMGQPRNVIVFRLLAAKTIDERIMDLLATKQNTFDAFADESFAAQNSIEIDEKEIGHLISEEIERIKKKRRGRGTLSEGTPFSQEAKSGLDQLSFDDLAAPENIAATNTAHSPNAIVGASVSNAEKNAEAAQFTNTPVKHRTSRRRKTFTFSVRGLNKKKTGELWMLAAPWSVTVVREKNNKYDKNAVALHINGKCAGYIPRHVVPPIAAMIDEGYTANVVSVEAEEVPEKRRTKDEWGDYYYEEDWRKTFVVAKVKIHLQEKKQKRPLKKPKPRTKEKPSSPQPLSRVEADQLKDNLPETLTEKQETLYLLLSQGLSRSDVGFAMGIRESTLRDHVRALYRLLGVRNKHELIEQARKRLEAIR